ncbi:alpha/beta hydrolase [Rhodococcus sovatensis]|uniref:Alpha/beta hydrolase n=1 Tax=Rhodococcus sovatensis TaxID=1805840 RepID=A0ABZ2PJA7_9NOCA
MTSLAARLMPLAISLRGSKRRFSSADRTMARIDKTLATPGSYEPPRSVTSKVTVTRDDTSGWPVYRVSPHNSTPPRASVYFHGGAYIAEITATHWRTIAKLAAATDTTFVVPIYPLAPTETASTTVGHASEIAESVTMEYGSEHVVLMGDSAGGGMALAVAQQLRDAGVTSVAHIVLISPWLDVAMTDPEIEKIAPHDPWLAVPGTRLAGELYRGELPVDDPRVSPLRGDLHGLAPITLFSGTRDIANADARSLVKACRSIGASLHYHEASSMLHVYPLLPIPEGRRALSVIAAVLNTT